MADSSLVTDFAIVLGVATVTGTLARRLQQPPILGYLLAGLIVGPYIPIPLFADVDRVHALSEVGVVLVMFAVGLEFSLRRAVSVLPLAGPVAAVQIGGMFWAGSVLGGLLGFSTGGQVVTGASLAISSTMVVIKVFDLRPPPDAVRSLVLGVLVLQDLAAIVLITVVTAVAEGAEADSAALLGVVGRLAGVMAASVLIGLLLVPRLTRSVSRLRTPEVDTLFAAGLCFALAAVMVHLGYSAALGAFLAGMLVAESGLSLRYEHLIAPIRDVFAAIFFVSVGMTIDPRVAIDHVGEAAGVAAVVIGLQALFVTAAGVLSGVGLRPAAHAGIALGQLGEFAFIIVGVGAAAGVVPPHLFTVVVMVAVITAFTTTLGLKVAPRLIAAVEHRLPHRIRALLSVYSAWVEGARRGEGMGAMRRRTRRLVLVLALDAGVVAVVVVGGSLLAEHASGSLAARLRVGDSVATAGVVVATGAVAFAFARGMWRAAHALGTGLAAAAFPRAGVDLVSTSRSTMGRAIQLAALLAAGLLVAGLTQPFVPSSFGFVLLIVAVVPAAVALWRTGRPLDDHVRSATIALFEVLRRVGDGTEDDPVVADLLHGLGDVNPVRLEASSPAVGKTLAAIDLRAKTGATVLAIVRGDENIGTPTGRETLEAGDVLALAGPAAAVEDARALLLGAPEGVVDQPGAVSPTP